ncbi:MAG TPA: beta-ketoacyl synthase N-terminal-like domain-containing protein [Planctomycetaceae bacterium]|nr:beta-ketoacyl synthase N-terminal-like domain-containing protein [Planctomycetaceae bacterium]
MLEFSSHNGQQDVLVTGLGVVTPLGCSTDETWGNLLGGRRAGRILTAEDIDHFPELGDIDNLRAHGAPVDHSEVADRLASSDFLANVSTEIASIWLAEPMVAMSLVALDEALRNCGLRPCSLVPERTAVVYGSSKGGLRSTERMITSMAEARRWIPETAMAEVQYKQRDGNLRKTERSEPPDRMNSIPAIWDLGVLPDCAANAITALTGARVASSCAVAACATGLIAFLQGAAMIHRGECDVCFVGSADAGLRSSVLASFHRLRVTSRNADPASACRPFDESRDGFLIGEGAAVGVLESRAHAESRGATPIARIVGGGWLNDPTGMTQIDESGAVVHELLKRTLTMKNRRPDFLCLHGTGTESNDLAEARGVQAAFGKDPPLCFGVKGAIGHLLGAAGSVETALTLLALQRGKIPATANLRSIDRRCQIPLQTSVAAMPAARTAAKLSLGFGGHLACGVFERI